ncbi:class I SAM-dependent methyltransferase [Nitratifractor sp.]
MNRDKAGEKYWESVWSSSDSIRKFDIDYYTNRLLHELYLRYIPKAKNGETICEIGCAMSQYLLYFSDHFNYRINGFDYEEKSVEKTKSIYSKMGYGSNIYHKDFFSKDGIEQYDLLTSFGVFEHFENLNHSIACTVEYLKTNGVILTVIPNMNGIVGFLQKHTNRAVYDVHIPYTREELQSAHERAGYETLFCDYFGIYQSGVINLTGNRFGDTLSKVFAVPGKPLYYLSRVSGINLDSMYNSPYIIYIGRKK